MPTAQDPDLDLTSLLPLRGLVVTLQFTQAAKPKFFHQAALTAFIRFLAGSPENYDQLIRIDTPESGRIRYQAGDYYRFMLIGLQGSDVILQTLITQLQKLPHSSPKSAQELPFRNNCKLLSLQDAFSELSIDSFSKLSQYDYPQLQQEVALWNGQTTLHWHWVSPVRLLKTKELRTTQKVKGEQRYIRDAVDLDGNLLFTRTYNALADLLRRRSGSSGTLAAPHNIHIHDMHLFWLDSHYNDAQKNATPMGGMTGRIHLQLPSNLSPSWWQLLLLGQYTGIGQRNAFGWGRYQLQTTQQHYSYRRILPASSLLSLAQQEENLHKAWRHVMAGRDELYSHSEDYAEQYLETEAVDEPADTPTAKLQRDLEKLLNNDYSVPTLQGYLLPKKNGGVRPLAVPPIYDRVLQRALSQTLSPALEQLMDRHSHGFRPGRSRITASYEIQAAWRSGYRWVYESDIKNFFDSVNLEHLRDRLNGIYYGDPIINAIINWMQAPVRFQGQTIERKNGLPQGSPLSPLMANLMLDDFDSDMQAAGFLLIRFADDFIILCKDPQQAQAAEQAAQRSLAEHGFELHPDKSHITALDEGFKYLGYCLSVYSKLELLITATETNPCFPAFI
ncbi:MAG: CRISP-associated protein Cas1 [Methyloprofundus sp.]|nr:MAG: CRISP-associated protein Cas1 [Methyloprofundus sp.]